MKESIKNKLREDLSYYGIKGDKLGIKKEDGSGLMDSDVWTRLEKGIDSSLKNLAKEYAGEFEGGAQEAFGHILEIVNRRYGIDY